MKATTLLTAIALITIGHANAGNSLREDLKKAQLNKTTKTVKAADIRKKHAKESAKVANEQDEISADVQDLIQDQADPQVINLLNQAESLMVEAIDLLELKKTGGNTIAIQTEIIEKIIDAAKKKQQNSGAKGKGQQDSMMQMLEDMRGKGKKPSDKKGKKEGSNPGKGSEGTTDKESKLFKGPAGNTKEERLVPKNSTTPNRTLPREEQRALDAYNNVTAKSKKNN